jgi:hypothetical protein
MTSKQKAKELVQKFRTKVNCYSDYDGDLKYDESVRVQNAKQCALIAVEEIIDAIKHEDNRMFYEIKFWQEVKTEIKEL